MSPNNQIQCQDKTIFHAALKSIREQAAHDNQRAVLVLSGEKDWCDEHASLIADIDVNSVVEWIGKDRDVLATQKQHFSAKLGREVDVLIFPLSPSFDANRLTALSGMIRGGGLLVFLLTKDLWNSASHFDQRFIHALHHRGIHWLQENKDFKINIESSAQQENDDLFLSEQSELVKQLLQRCKTQERATIVVQSDRGRGKSASLGLAAAKWLAAGESVFLTGPSLKSVEQVFFHAKQVLAGAALHRGCLSYRSQQLKFLPPDAVHAEYKNIKRLLVDEAAAIPIPKLTDWLQHIPQLVFSTTIHGYEGTGKGFLLKFVKVLDQQRKDWKKFKLQHPIRWASDDFLEQWLNQTFLLDVDIALLDQTSIAALGHSTKLEPTVDKYLAAEFLDSGFERDVEIIKALNTGTNIQRYSNYELLTDDLLKQVYGLLVNAHYRTTPKDLRYLLDTDAASIYALWQGQQCLAAAWVLYEGEFDQELSDAVYLGTRRPPGHLLAQSLTYHCAIQDAATHRYARIVRIAVHPQCQQQGLGSHLLQHIIKSESEVDVIGTSFSATPEGLDFWQKNIFTPVRIGMTQHQSSGEHSVMLLHPVSEAGQAITDKARSRMLDALPYHLKEPLVDLDKGLVTSLSNNKIMQNNDLSDDDWQELVLFAYANRTYAEALSSLVKLVQKSGIDSDALTETQQKLIKEKVLMHKTWDEVVSDLELNGKKQAIHLLRETVMLLLQQISSSDIQRKIDWVVGLMSENVSESLNAE